MASSYKCFGDEQGEYPLQCPGVLQTCGQRRALPPLTLKLISANQWPLCASAASTVLLALFLHLSLIQLWEVWKASEREINITPDVQMKKL